jgi:hypothetical protein
MEKQAIMPVEVRAQLADALRLDLVGPEEGLGDGHEILPQRPSTSTCCSSRRAAARPKPTWAWPRLRSYCGACAIPALPPPA